MTLGFVGAHTAVAASCLHCTRWWPQGASLQGSGKTLAFGLPVLNYLVSEARHAAEGHASADATAKQRRAIDVRARNKLRALILCPTRELAMQVSAHLTALAKPLAVRVVAIVGGIAPQKQARLLGYKPPVIVATPGRLWDSIHSGSNAHVSDLTGLSFLVLDEADRMVKQGNFEELTHILKQIPAPASECSVAATNTAAGDAPSSSQALDADNEQTDDAAHNDQGKDGVADDRQDVSTPASVLDGPLHTYVFSATLTLPEALKARLQRGRGGSRGSGAGATFESLMQRITFRGKPKV